MCPACLWAKTMLERHREFPEGERYAFSYVAGFAISVTSGPEILGSFCEEHKDNLHCSVNLLVAGGTEALMRAVMPRPEN